MWTIFKVFIEFVTILLLFYVLAFLKLNLLQYCLCFMFFFFFALFLCFMLWQGMWGLSSLARDGTLAPCIGRQSPKPLDH